ncbi:MAG: histidinol-phosphate transaminase [Chloroflexi bacterium]|nr:histidinol-phosphate transaminase [Chloroflexota bacterium]
MNFEQFVRPEIAQMKPYMPIVPFAVLSRRLGRPSTEIIKLDANENPYGASPKALAALAELPYVHIYPDPEAAPLREALSGVTGVPQERLLAGAGADELIDLIFRAVLSPGDGVVDCPPSFGMYPFSTAVNAGRYIPIRRKADFSLDVAEIERTVREQRPKLLVLCSPNNPDGSVIDDDNLRRLLALPVLVLLDEAYVDFAEGFNRGGRGERRGKEGEGYAVGRLRWVMDYDNLMVLRTFSKLAGLAGLRVGYGAFPDWLLPHLWKIKQPYNISAAASAAAIAALDDLAWLEEKRRLIVAERERLERMLAAVDWLRPYPSQANFILCRVDGRDAAQLQRDLAQQGILVRYFNKPGLDNCIRISVGRPSDTDILLKALREIGD